MILLHSASGINVSPFQSHCLKERYQKDIPNNITTLKHFQQTAENKDDFLSYGSASKNVYLLLLEDF